MTSDTYNEGFEEFLQRKNYSSDLVPVPKYTKLYTIIGDRGKGYSKCLFRSQLEGKQDLFCIGFWDTEKNEPMAKLRITMNLYDLERLHDYLAKLLRSERGF